MALFKVTTLQGKLVIKNPKNITKSLFYYLYFILSYSNNMRNDGYTKNTVGEKGSSILKPVLSKYNMKRSKVEDFLGHCLQY